MDKDNDNDNDYLPKYWNHKDIEKVEAAKTFEDLLLVAVGVMRRMPLPISMVCGPITSGGLGNKADNIRVFKKEILRLSLTSNVSVFSQMPFEEAIWKIQKTNYYKGGDHTLEALYLPIFESGFVWRLYFIPGWQSSYGAKWEYEQAKRLKLEIVYL